MNKIYFILILFAVMIVNYPVITYIAKLKNTKCDCTNSWKLDYLYYYILFWYGTTSLQILILSLIPTTVDWYAKSIFYYPGLVVSSVSYTFYIIILWSYVEYLKESNCECAKIKKEKYVLTYAWFLFLLYVVSVSYLGVTLSYANMTK